ncbi:MAG: magnesium transporter [Gammaproteobacteria bacterium]
MKEIDDNRDDTVLEEKDIRVALDEALESADGERLTEIVESISSQDALRHVSRLHTQERDRVVSLITPEAAANLVDDAPEDLAVSLIEGLESSVAAKIMDELPSDTQADIVTELETDEAEAILSKMDPDEAAGVRRLAEFEPDSAGGLMELDIFSFPVTETVGAVLERMARGDEDFERFRGQHPYVIDTDGRLVGVVSLRGLLTSRRAVALAEIMSVPLTVTPDISQEDLEDLFEEYPFLGMPVVDDLGSPLGVVSRVAVAEAKLKRSEHESLSRQRMSDELRSMPTWFRSRRRLAWLSSNIVLNIIAASVISAYEETLAAVIAIAVFLPMVSDMSGCSGNQAVGVSMRELALGLARPADLFHVWRKEITVGVINGIVLGIMIGIVAWLWKGSPYLGLVIGLALAANTMIAVSIGGTVPLLLKRLGVDPAVASGPLLTTVTDMAGFFLVLSLATLFMPYLLL